MRKDVKGCLIFDVGCLIYIIEITHNRQPTTIREIPKIRGIRDSATPAEKSKKAKPH
jgi:hypothetical protein